MAVALEGLSYEIEAQTGDSAKQIDTLTSSLEKLKSASGGLKLGNVSGSLKKLSEAVSGIDAKSIMKLRQLSEGLGKLASAGDIRISKSIGTGISSIAKSMDGVTDEKIDRISRLAEALQKLGDVGPVKVSGIKDLDKATEAVTEPARTAPAAQPVSQEEVRQPQVVDTVKEPSGLNEYIQDTLNMATATEKVRGALSMLKSQAVSTAKSMAELGATGAQAAGKLAIGFAKLPLMFGGQVLGGIKSTISGLGGVFSGLMRIAKFRAYRTVIKIFTEGLSQGIENLYYYSQLAGTGFAGALDSIATSANYVKNSLGAMASPLIEAVAPAIDFIADKVVALFNLINQLISRLTGKSTYTAAKKISSTYKSAADSAGKGASGAAKKAADELKKTILGFDEINKLNEPNKSSGGSGGGGGGAGGGGGGYGDMFEELPIEQSISDFADRIKDLINAGDWEGLGRLFGDKLNQIFDLGGGAEADAKWTGWGHKIAGYINNAIDVAYGFLSETSFENIGKRVAQLLNGIFDLEGGINFLKLGKTLSLAFTDAVDFLIGFIKEFDTRDLGTQIRLFCEGFFQHFIIWVNGSDREWDEFGETLYEKIRDAIEGLNPAEIGEYFGVALEGAFKAGVQIAEGFLRGAFSDAGDWIRESIDENGLFGTGEIIWDKIIEGIVSYTDPYRLATQYIVDPFMDAVLGEDKWEDLKDAANDIIYNIGQGFIEPVTNPATFGRRYIIDPMMNNLLGEEKWEKAKGVAQDIIANVAKGFIDLITNPVALVKTYIIDPLMNALIGKDKWESAKKAADQIMANIADGFVKLVTNPAALVKQYIIDPIMNELVGKDKWDGGREVGTVLMHNIADGIVEMFTDPIGFVKRNLIDPMTRPLENKDNWNMDKTGDTIFDSLADAVKKKASGWAKEHIVKPLEGLFGKGDGSGNGSIPVPLSPKVQNNSRSWLSDIQGWWNGIFGGEKNSQKFTGKPQADKKEWLGYIGGAWEGILGKGKNSQKFTAEPDQKASRNWLSGIQNWWNGLFGGKKNTQKFNAEGEATKLHDKIPQAQKKFDSTALFKEGRDNLGIDKKTFNSTANFTNRRNLSEPLRTFESTANFTRRNNLSEANRTFDSKANFTNRSNLSETLRTFASIANFTTRANNLTTSEKTFSSTADFTSRQDSLSRDERKLDAKAWFTKADQSKTFTVDVIGHIIRTSGGSRGYAASGGVFTSKGKVPIQRYASGGLASGSQLFWAREKGPELVGTLGSHTAVMNNDQIVASVSAGVARAIAGIHFSIQGMKAPEPVPINEYVSAPEPARNNGNAEMISEARQQNALLRRQNDLLQRLLDKDTTVEVTTKQFANAANRQNRREGRTTIAVSAT